MRKLRLARAVLIVAAVALVPAGVAAQEDATPPVLVSLAFSPAAVDVSAGAAEVTVTVRVTDDLAGFSWGWARFVSPSGLQAGSAWFDAATRMSGTDQDGVYQATMTIPQYIEGGTWHLAGASVCDRVANTANYSIVDLIHLGFPTELVVEGGADLAPPVLVSLAFSPAAVDVSAGAAEVTVTVRVTDDLAGFAWGWARFVSPSGLQAGSAWFDAATRMSGTDQDGVYQATMTIPQYIEGGTWHLAGASVCDRVANTANYSSADLASLGFLVELTVQSEPEDHAPPRLVSLAFSPAAIDVSAGAAEVTVTVRVTDDLAGLAWGWARFVSPSGLQAGSAWFDAATRMSGTARDGVYQATMTIPQYIEGGTWHLAGASVSDGVANSTNYSSADLVAMGCASELVVNVNAPPVAQAGPDRNAILGELLAFDGSASSDPGGSIASYVWDFGDGVTAADPAPAHSYSAAGTFTVTLTVTDDDGATASDTAVVTVQTLAGIARSLSALLLNYNLKQGVATSLNQKLQNVLAALEAANAGQRQDAANKLGAFINAVDAQRGKALTSAQADQLEALARRILAVLG